MIRLKISRILTGVGFVALFFFPPDIWTMMGYIGISMFVFAVVWLWEPPRLKRKV